MLCCRSQHRLARFRRVGAWSLRNGLLLSMEKCVCLYYGSKNQGADYVINGHQLKVSENCTNLGVIRSSDFLHINRTCLKASRLTRIVTKLFSTINCQFLNQLFYSYIRPALEYGSIIWNPVEVGLSNQLERIQRRFMRRLYYRDSPVYEVRLYELGISSLQSRRRSFAYKLLHSSIDVEAKACGLQLISSNTHGNGINYKCAPC